MLLFLALVDVFFDVSVHIAVVVCLVPLCVVVLALSLAVFCFVAVNVIFYCSCWFAVCVCCLMFFV